MNLHQIYDGIRARFPSDCNDEEPCIHNGKFYQHGEWKHLVRSALEYLKKEHIVAFTRADRKYRLN